MRKEGREEEERKEKEEWKREGVEALACMLACIMVGAGRALWHTCLLAKAVADVLLPACMHAWLAAGRAGEPAAAAAEATRATATCYCRCR